MNYYVAHTDYSVVGFKGNLTHDYGQFEINGGEFIHMVNFDNGKYFYDVGETAEQELEFMVFETPGTSDSENYVQQVLPEEMLHVLIDFVFKH